MSGPSSGREGDSLDGGEPETLRDDGDVAASKQDFSRRVVRSAGWVALEKWGVRASTLVVFAVLARLLEPSEFGLVALASVFVAVLAVFVDSGFSQALVQRARLDREHADTAFWISLSSSLVLAGMLCLVSPVVARAMGEPDLTFVLQALSLNLPLTALSGVPAAILQRKFGFRELAFRRIVGTLSGSAAGIALAVAGAGIWALIAQTLVTTLVGVIVLWTASSWRPGLNFSRRSVRELWSFGSNSLGIELLALANGQADKLLIGVFVGPTALGYYFVGARIAQVLLDLLTSVTASLSLTTFSRLQQDRDRMVRAFQRFSFMSAAVAFPTFAIIAVLASDLIPLVFGDQWRASAPIMQWLAPSAALTAITWFDKSLFMAVGRPRTALLLAIGQTVLGLVLLAVALPFGIVAVAVSRSIRQVLFWPVRLVALRRHVNLGSWQYVSQFVKPAVAAAAAGCAAWIARQSQWLPEDALVSTAICAALGGLLYLGIMSLTARPELSLMLKSVRR